MLLENVLWDSAPPAAVRGALRERFVGHVPPLQLWQLVLTACLVATAVVLIAAGPMNVAAGLDFGISFLDHIHSWKGYVPVALWPVYPLLPRGVPY